MSYSIQTAMYYGLNPCFDRLYAESKLSHEFVHLMDEICNRENILLAYRNIKRNDGSVTPGVDGMTIDHLENLTIDSLVTLVQNKLRWYIPRPVRRVEIPKPYDPYEYRQAALCRRR